MPTDFSPYPIYTSCFFPSSHSLVFTSLNFIFCIYNHLYITSVFSVFPSLCSLSLSPLHSIWYSTFYIPFCLPSVCVPLSISSPCVFTVCIPLSISSLSVFLYPTFNKLIVCLPYLVSLLPVSLYLPLSLSPCPFLFTLSVFTLSIPSYPYTLYLLFHPLLSVSPFYLTTDFVLKRKLYFVENDPTRLNKFVFH